MFLLKYLRAARLFSLPCSLFSALIGYLYADHSKSTTLVVFACTCAAVAVLHIGANLLNTYYDYKYKIDDDEHCFDDTIVKKHLPEDDVLNAAWLCCALAMMLFGSGVVVTRTAHLVPYLLFFKGIFLGFNYSTGLKLKHNCLGEFIVYMVFGPSIATFVYSCLSSGKVSWEVTIAASPVGLVVASVLFANNVRDAGHDLKCGVKTVANQLGIKNSLNLYSILLIMPYVQVTGFAILYSHFIVTWLWVLIPVTLYIAYKPHTSSPDAISQLFNRTLVNFNLFSATYLVLLYCAVVR